MINQMKLKIKVNYHYNKYLIKIRSKKNKYSTKPIKQDIKNNSYNHFQNHHYKKDQ